MESWFSGMLDVFRNRSGKHVALTADSRKIRQNPLHRVLEAKSFTRNDVLLHFLLLDILKFRNSAASPAADAEMRSGITGAVHGLSLQQILRILTLDYLSTMPAEWVPDERTVRNKLKEDVGLGLLECSRNEKQYVYRLSGDLHNLSSWRESLAFFGEGHLLGAIGAPLLRRMSDCPDCYSHKQRYLHHALDCDILSALLAAKRDRKLVQIRTRRGWQCEPGLDRLSPVCVVVRAQDGRAYLGAYSQETKRARLIRADWIEQVVALGKDPTPDEALAAFERQSRHRWGVSMGDGETLQHVTIRFHTQSDEVFLMERVEREKRCGHLERLGPSDWTFTADVLDPVEMLPWLRRHIGRIVSFTCSDTETEALFKADLLKMANLYGCGEVHDALS